MVYNMVNSLFDKGTMKKFDALAKNRLSWKIRKKSCKKSMETMNSETLVDVLGIVKNMDTRVKKAI